MKNFFNVQQEYNGTLLETAECKHDFTEIYRDEYCQILKCSSCKYISIGWFRTNVPIS
jgi:hypothetical protein